MLESLFDVEIEFALNASLEHYSGFQLAIQNKCNHNYKEQIIFFSNSYTSFIV